MYIKIVNLNIPVFTTVYCFTVFALKRQELQSKRLLDANYFTSLNEQGKLFVTCRVSR